MSDLNLFEALVVGGSFVGCAFVVIMILRALAGRAVQHFNLDADDVAWAVFFTIFITITCVIIVIPLGLVLREYYPDTAAAILGFWGAR